MLQHAKKRAAPLEINLQRIFLLLDELTWAFVPFVRAKVTNHFFMHKYVLDIVAYY